jgi:hypothetical protein
MSEWWTYRPADFLLFSPSTYFRLFELYNEWLWPAQPLVALGWLALLAELWRGAAWAPRALLLALALAWAWIAWAFHAQRYAAINWAASGFAVAFALQAAVLSAAAFGAHRLTPPPRLGIALLAGALLAMPLIPPAFGRAWVETESFGLTPDATALGTLGVLLMFVPAYRVIALIWWLVPLCWIVVSGLSLYAMGESVWALLLPMAAVASLAAHRRRRHECAY